MPHGTTGRIDLYRRGCFVLEAKQGSDRAKPGEVFSQEAERRLKGHKHGTAMRGTAARDTAMARARQQAQSYPGRYNQGVSVVTESQTRQCFW